MSFTHLRVRTHRSLKEGLMTVDELLDRAVAEGHESLAVTDLKTLSGVIEFQAAAAKRGIKPIVGVDAWIETDLTDPDQKTPTRLLLLAADEAGYRRLMALLTRANVENVNGDTAMVKQSWLAEGTDGIVALTGDPDTGEIPRAALKQDRLAERLEIYRRLFPDRLFLEVSRYGHPDQDEWCQRLADLSVSSGIPLVATNAVMFGQRADFFTHEVHTAITTGRQVLDPSYVPASTREQFYKSTEDMRELFKDMPQAVENAFLLSNKLNAAWKTGVNHLPEFPVPPGRTLDDVFVDAARKGLDERMLQLFPDPAERAKALPEYTARLDREIGVILDMGFPGYFMVVSDFINWSKSKDIPVGPGRGSGAGSLVAFALNITEIDPIKYSLLFERFLNPERVSMPDIDVDFCRDRRDETINYLFSRYGSHAVSQISTFNTLAAKASIRGVGRALNYPLLRVDEIARMVPTMVGITIEEAIKQSPKLAQIYDNDRQAKRLLDMAMAMEHRAATTGVHAGGVIIAPGRIDDYAPTMISEKGVIVTQYDYHDAEAAGLIKFDLLGLKTLTTLHAARNLINARPDRAGNPLALNAISLDDKPALDLLRAGQTYGVFQLESRGMTELVKSLQPDGFEDVVALLALYRPGPLNSGMVEDFVRRKHGQAPISYYHPKLEQILKPTYGIIVYQEQVMQIAQAVAGYSLGGADLLRRAMGKKKPEEMAKERIKFEQGAIANGIEPELAKELFDVMEKFAEYGFNRSHSAAYAMLSMQSAHLKAVYPAEYFTAYMNIEMDDTEVLQEAVIDAAAQGLKILPPDVNVSSSVFAVENGAIRYGLGALKGVSEKTAADVQACREEMGKFSSLPDFLTKLNDYMRKQGRNAPLKIMAESLIRAGAFDSIEPDRALLMAAVPEQLRYIGAMNKRASKVGAGSVLMGDLWALAGVANPVPAPPRAARKLKPIPEPVWPEPENYTPWTDFEKFDQEAKTVGFFLTGHPYDSRIRQLDGLKAALPLADIPLAQLGPYEGVLIAGVVARCREHTTPTGAKMAFLTLSDGKIEQEVTVFAEALESAAKKLKVGAFITAEVNLPPSKRKPGTIDVQVRQVFTAEETEAMLATTLHVALTPDEMPRLAEINAAHASPARLPTVLHIPDGQDRYYTGRLKTMAWSGTPECIAALRDAFPGRIQFDFAPRLEFQSPKPASRQGKGGKFKR